jgi:hypothetical protein
LHRLAQYRGCTHALALGDAVLRLLRIDEGADRRSHHPLSGFLRHLDAADLRTEQVFFAPLVVAEVLSPTTEVYDRGLKFTLYRTLPSLHGYILVDPDTCEVQLFRRGADGLFFSRCTI